MIVLAIASRIRTPTASRVCEESSIQLDGPILIQDTANPWGLTGRLATSPGAPSYAQLLVLDWSYTVNWAGRLGAPTTIRLTSRRLDLSARLALFAVFACSLDVLSCDLVLGLDDDTH